LASGSTAACSAQAVPSRSLFHVMLVSDGSFLFFNSKKLVLINLSLEWLSGVVLYLVQSE
jgi:hypothetical protein